MSDHAEYLAELVSKQLKAYEAHPDLISEHAALEEQAISGAYGHRQIFELVQNSADAIRDGDGRGRIQVELTEDVLYCANEGAPLSKLGIRALLMSNLSPKREDEIGRFGLGFKSVLGVCEQPEIFSTTCDLEFNPSEAAARLRTLGSRAESIPRLRTAAVCDREKRRRDDPVLDELLEWATTVVRLRLKPGRSQTLGKDLEHFPSEFLVFTRHVELLGFQRRDVDWDRTMRTSVDEERVTVSDGGSETTWLVVSRSIERDRLSRAAVDDMDTRLRERESLPLHWAVPLDSVKRRNGRLWAFFPTQDEITLQGIVNAPWKTNSDRENLLDGPFNRELLGIVADTIAAGVDRLNTESDPARFLDVLPARDSVGWADGVLTERLIAVLMETTCMPTVLGDRSRPAEARLRPDELPTERWLEWSESFAELEPPSLTHRSVEERERRARAKRLGSTAMTPRELLAAVAEPATPEASIAAIQFADLLLSGEGYVGSVSKEAFVLGTDGRLLPPDPDLIAFSGEETEDTIKHVTFVHPDLESDDRTKEILEERFEIRVVSPSAILRSFLAQVGMAGEWGTFWRLARRVEPEEVVRAARDLWGTPWTICAKAMDGRYRELGTLLILGGVVTDRGDVVDGSAFVDPGFHEDDRDILEALGAWDRPRFVDRYPGGRLARSYRMETRRAFTAACEARGAATPQSGYVVLRKPEERGYIAPVDALHCLGGDSAVAMSAYIIEFAWQRDPWKIEHKTRRTAYPSVEFDPFGLWVLRKHGWVPTSQGPVRARDAVGQDLSPLAEFFPVVDRASDFESLGLIPELDEGDDPRWRAALDRATSFSSDVEALTSFYALAARMGVPRPEEIRARAGADWEVRSPDDVIVASDEGEVRHWLREGRPFLYSPRPDIVETLVDAWDLERVTRIEVGFAPAGDAVRATDRFPGLSRFLDGGAPLLLQPCEELWRELRSAEEGLSTHEAEILFADERLYYLDRVVDSEAILRALRDRGLVDLAAEGMAALADEGDLLALEARRAEIRTLNSIEDRLVQAIGADRLRAGIPERHLRWLEGSQELQEAAVARLALAVHGVEVLKQYRDAMRANGLQPPERWAGGSAARSFVRGLGFPEEFAGFPGQGREPWADERGPNSLPPLHDFQRHVVQRMLDFFHAPTAGRGMLSLPTGAGKTRVAIQALVEWMTMEASDASVLWIAGSDELCEQAVESWLEAWRALGPDGALLRVNRLWGRTNERIQRPESGTSVVVATFQSLVNRVDREELDWVFDVSAVVIDEAHGATTPTFTRILERLGLGRSQTVRPLIGLTATPFRGGESQGETMRLAFRFEHRRFDLDLWGERDAYSALQDVGVLARAEHDRLEGVPIQLSEDELQQLKTFSRLPPEVELSLGRDELRNQRIFQHVESLPEDWPVLLFSPSKEHAEDLAVRLTMRGIPARSITGETPTGVRRHAVESFKHGELRVLTNYGVLTTGFDAPAVRAIYVTRPVYSPLLYQQMIGRGLRGPKNGGKDQCLIVNVEDNVEQYGETLAFHRFDHLWGS